MEKWKDVIVAMKHLEGKRRYLLSEVVQNKVPIKEDRLGVSFTQFSNHAKPRYNLSDKFLGLYLTQREAQCLIYITHGLKNKCIANILDLSVRTIEYYISNIMKKLEIHSRSGLRNYFKETALCN